MIKSSNLHVFAVWVSVLLLRDNAGLGRELVVAEVWVVAHGLLHHLHLHPDGPAHHVLLHIGSLCVHFCFFKLLTIKI